MAPDVPGWSGSMMLEADARMRLTEYTGPPTSGGWRGSGGGNQWTFFDGFDASHVEGGVNLERSGEQEADCGRVDHFRDGERTHKRSRLTRLHSKGEVPSGEPHFLTR